MSYEKYTKEQFDRACKDDWFNKDGNSTTAICNRGFIKEMLLDSKRLFISIIDVDIKELCLQLLGILVVVFSPLLFIPLLFSRAYFSRKRAKKEMMEYYIKDKIDKLHK